MDSTGNSKRQSNQRGRGRGRPPKRSRKSENIDRMRVSIGNQRVIKSFP